MRRVFAESDHRIYSYLFCLQACFYIENQNMWKQVDSIQVT